MAERYLFFNANEVSPGVWDREYQESDFADYFGSVLSTGLLHTDNIPGMKATVESGTLNTIVSPGKAIMKGHLYENTTDLTLTHSIPEATMDRIDRIVLRLDQRNQSRFIKLFVKEGTPSETPAPPDLQRDNFIHEISLAQVRVRKNTVQLMPADLIDERLKEDVCGLVYSLISVPTDQFQEKLDRFQSEWDIWFNNIQGTLPNEAKLVSVEDQKGYFNSSNVEGALKELFELNITNYRINKSGKDSNGIFRTVEYRRKTDNTLFAKSVLSGGTSPKYTTRTITYYAADGTTVVKAEKYTLSYDSDGDLISEV